MASAPLKVLFTNNRLSHHGGTQVYVRDVALELLARGHTPIAYSPRLGAVATEMQLATIPVVDDLAKLGVTPDVIHGQDGLETMTALLHFPSVPAVYFCHDWYSALDVPPPFPRIRRYVGVDAPCRDKLLFLHRVPEERVRLILNFVDPERFKPPRTLPARPARALLYSNYAEDDAYQRAIRAACEHAGLTLDVLGKGAGNTTSRPEELLGQYDLVFAKGRSALEAAAMGVGVILYFGRHAGPLVTSDTVEAILPLNFGIRAMTAPLPPREVGARIAAEIARYDANDPPRVSAIVRARSAIGTIVDQIVGVYDEAVEEQSQSGPDDLQAESRAAAAYLRFLSTEIVQNATRARFREKIERVPFIGRWAMSVARRVLG